MALTATVIGGALVVAGGMYLFSRVLAPRPVVLNPPGCRKIARTINENISESDIDILCSPSDCCVARNLNKKILTLYGRHLNDSGTEVDYEGFARDPEFQEYVDICRDLEKVHLSAMRREEWMSFLINLYNCLVIHGYLERGVPGNLLSRLYFFSSVSYRIGGQVYSLDDIEHGLLRHNRKHPAPFISKPPFSDSDERLEALAPCGEFDPRIHFALVCGAKSCPPIRIFTPENLDHALDMAARNFCRENVLIDVETRTVTVSKLMLWYEKDFGENALTMIKTLRQWLLEEQQEALDQVMLEEEKVTISYLPYNWELNK